MAATQRLAAALLLLVPPAAAQVLPLRVWPAGQGTVVGATGDLDGDGLADLAAGGIDMSVLLRDPAGGFEAPVVLTVTGDARHVALGHVNGDDLLDLVCTNVNAATILAVRFGHGAGGFGPQLEIPMPGMPNGLALGDFDGDGDDDVAVSLNSDAILILSSDGAGGLTPTGSVPTADKPTVVRAGDIDEDGDLDLVTPASKAAQVNLLVGDGAGTFTASAMAAPPSPLELLLADMDVDGHLDLILGPAGPVARAEGHGDGTFEPWSDLPFDAFQLHVADLDGNGLPDIVGFDVDTVASVDTVVVQLGMPGGPFVPLAEFESGSVYSGAITTLDTNDDGLQDLLFGSTASGIGVARGLGFGEFERFDKVKFDADPQDMVAADFDHDGDVDVAVASAMNPGPGGVVTLRNDRAGSFTQVSDMAFGPKFDIETGDVDADGNLDLVSTDGETKIHVQLGDGTLDYGAATVVGFGILPRDAAVADLDGDGDDDIATCFGAPGRLGVFWSDGAGGFSGLASKGVTIPPARIAIADLDADGQLDLVSHSEWDNSLIGVLLHGTAFLPPVLTPIEEAWTEFTVGDLDGDGLPEAVVLGAPPLFLLTNTYLIHESDGSGGFAPATQHDAGVTHAPLMMADVDGDADLDLVALGGLVALTLNDGAGALAPPQLHSNNGMFNAITVGDVTGDGYPDVLCSLGLYESDVAEMTVLAGTGPAQPWKSLGQGKAGALGIPMLVGHGTLQPGTPLSLELRGAAPASAATLVIGLSALSAPFMGGLLVPDPDFFLAGLVTDAQGSVLLGADWPDNVPAGLQSWYQFWIADPEATADFSASNGVTAVAP